MTHNRLHPYLSIFIIAFCSCLLLSSCEDLLVKELDIEEDFNFEMQLGLSGTLSNNFTENSFPEESSILLAENQSIIDLIEDPIYYNSDALDLYQDGTYYNTFVNIEDGRHFNFLENSFPNYFDFEPATYRIEVNHPEFGLVSSETQMPEPVFVNSIEIDSFNFGSNYYDEFRYLVTVQFDDPPGENYYKFDIVNDSLELVFDTIIINMDTIVFQNSAYSYIESVNVQGAQESYNGGYLIEDAIFDGTTYTFTFNMVVGNVEDELDLSSLKESFSLRWACLSEDQYNFEASYTSYQNSQDFGPFSEPVSIFTNIDNGLGYFGAENFYFAPFSE